ncbi:MAG: hypothetical protein APF84_06810 [Gracilibacter sp. BRH_c7a]|nr:MAG: hypothetical protein APF84_06810 [Gracilibacter sp. BRH_c7a]
MKEQCLLRITAFQKILQQQGLDLALFVDRENLIYFTGNTQIECGGLLIPKEGEATLVTLWLDVAHLKKESGIDNIVGYVFPDSNLGLKLVEVIREHYSLTKPRVGFGKYFVEFNVFDVMQKSLPGMEYHSVSEQVYELRSIKNPQEISCLTKAAEIVKVGIDSAIKAIKPGRFEVEVLAEAERAMRLAGSEGASFRMQVLSGERKLLTHPYAGNFPLKEDNTIVILLGASYQGYCSKMCRTVALGKVDPEEKIIYETILKAQQAAIQALKPGVSVKEVYKAAYEVIAKAGYARYFIDDIGHGMGLRQSEFYPVIGRTRNHFIRENMVVDLMFPTIFKKNVGGARVTDMIHVTAQSPVVLTEYPTELITIE